MAPTIDQLFRKHGDAFGVDPDMIKAVAMRESSLNSNALRNNPPRDISAGMMQVLFIPGADGHPVNFPDIPAADYSADTWHSLVLDDMYDPDISIYWGTLILHSYLRDFGFPRGIARYNMRAAANSPVGGPFPNQSYVHDILNNLAKLKGITAL